PERAMALFHWSITYVSLLFGVMAVDALLSGGFPALQTPCVKSRTGHDRDRGTPFRARRDEL
ncbi:MAG: hypothetical protein ABWZ89_10795, partial [Acidimicrobiales bacterium]